MTERSLPPFGRLAWIDVTLLAWFALTVVSVAYVAYDAFTRNPESGPGLHEEFVRPLWKQGMGSVIHCAGGKCISTPREGRVVPRG